MSDIDEAFWYRLDVEGVGVIPGLLPELQCQALDGVFDAAAHEYDDTMPDELKRPIHRMGPVTAWDDQIAELARSPKLTGLLTDLLGPGHRLDHDYADEVEPGLESTAIPLHNGGVPFDAAHAYTFALGRPRASMVVVAVTLSDLHPGSGGFCYLPGSHKANLPVPPEWRGRAGLSIARGLSSLEVSRGSAIVFPEALTHGSLPWRGDRPRRTLYFKYAAASIQWSGQSTALDWPDGDDSSAGVFRGALGKPATDRFNGSGAS